MLLAASLAVHSAGSHNGALHGAPHSDLVATLVVLLLAILVVDLKVAPLSNTPAIFVEWCWYSRDCYI